MVRVPHAGLTSLTLADNTTGSTKYDKILIVLAAATLITPPADGDFAEATCIVTERHNAANEAVTAANAFQLAEVTVANGFSTIANAVIADKRTAVGIPYNGSLNGGWSTYTGAAKTYASASTISVTSDATTIFSIGTKIRFKQGGDWKYGYCTASSATLLTLTGGTDYTVANAPIDVLEYSYESSPVGFPANSNTFSPLGVAYAQITSNFSTTAVGSDVDVTNLAITITIPTGKRIMITTFSSSLNNNTGASINGIRIKEGSTVLSASAMDGTTAGMRTSTYVSYIGTPSAGSHTYKIAITQSAAGTLLLAADGTYPAFIMAEIV
jgi:hypothetical protein